MKVIDLNRRARHAACPEWRTISWQTIWKKTNSRVDRLVSTVDSLDSRITRLARVAKKARQVRPDNRADSPERRKRAARARMKITRTWTGSAAPPNRGQQSEDSEVPALA